MGYLGAGAVLHVPPGTSPCCGLQTKTWAQPPALSPNPWPSGAPAPAFTHQTLPFSQMEPRFSDRNRPEKTLRLAALQGGSCSSAVEADDNLPEGIALENGSVVIQGESSATVILGSFHLNCCRGQFFHDKQIASIPQPNLVGQGGGGEPRPPSPSTAPPAWGPESPPHQGLAAVARHAVETGTGRTPAGSSLAAVRRPEEPSHITRGIQLQSSRYDFEVKSMFEIKKQRKPLPS